MKRSIRNSAKALVIKDGRILAVKIKDNNEEWYILPGGGQESEELLPEAVCREVAEETGIQVTADELVFVMGTFRSNMEKPIIGPPEIIFSAPSSFKPPAASRSSA